MSNRIHFPIAVMLAIHLLALSVPAMAADHYVAPSGNPGNAGTEGSPWDLDSTWAGKQDVEPGATIFLLPGVYRHPQREWTGGNFVLSLAGEQDAPIHIRPLPGARVTIDGGLIVDGNSQYVWMWDLEFTISESRRWDRRVTEPGSHPQPALAQPQGGITINGGRGNKFINLVVHDNNSTGISFWRGAVDAEIHGCLIYNNGWIGPDRFHGPGIYTQNETGNKWITDNILFGNYSTTIQAYGSSRAWVDGFRIIGNIAFAPRKEGGRARVLVGGGRPSKDIVVSENILYEVPLQIGYTAPFNEDCVVHDNFVLRAPFSIHHYRTVDQRNNTTISSQQPPPEIPHHVLLRPNKYDPHRANLAIVNWGKAKEVAVDMSPFLQSGDRVRVINALDFFGPPVVQAIYEGHPVNIPIPVHEATGNGEFCAFVVFRER
jgi:hypothetical protein